MNDLLTLTGPSIKRGRSKQDYETPDDFMVSVHSRFGDLSVDLAATPHNSKAPKYITREMNSFNVDWRHYGGTAWLNPEFNDIGPWAERCMLMAPSGGPFRILFLTPASIGANWFRDYVHRKAMVIALNGRLTFKGADDPYPKDTMLSVFGVEPGFDVWDWRKLI